MKKEDLIAYLDEYLNINDIKDNSQNGLQVDNSKKEIKKIGYAVDAATYIFDRAIEEKVDMVLVHHGILWGLPIKITGFQYERVKRLINNDIALYASHLPLDKNKNVGNNMGLINEFIKFFGLGEGQYYIEDFGDFGYGIKLEKEVFIDEIVDGYTKYVDIEKNFFDFGNKKIIMSIAFVSGSGLSLLQEAKDKDYNLLISGEGSHEKIQIAKELGQSILLGGHYETEKIGPALLANHIREMFGIEIVFLDEKY